LAKDEPSFLPKRLKCWLLLQLNRRLIQATLHRFEHGFMRSAAHSEL